MSTIKLQEFAFHTGSAASCNPKPVGYQVLPSAESSTDQLMAECRNNVKLVFFPDAYYSSFISNILYIWIQSNDKCRVHVMNLKKCFHVPEESPILLVSMH